MMKIIIAVLMATITVFDDVIAFFTGLATPNKSVLINEEKGIVLVPQVDVDGTTVTGVAVLEIATRKVTVCADAAAYDAVKLNADFVQVEDETAIDIIDFVNSEIKRANFKPFVLEVAEILPGAVMLKDVILYKDTASSGGTGGTATDMTKVETLLKEISRKI